MFTRLQGNFDLAHLLAKQAFSGDQQESLRTAWIGRCGKYSCMVAASSNPKNHYDIGSALHLTRQWWSVCRFFFNVAWCFVRMPKKSDRFLWVPVDPKTHGRPEKIVKSHAARHHVRYFETISARPKPDRTQDDDATITQATSAKENHVSPESLPSDEPVGPHWLINLRVNPENVLGSGGLDPFNMFPCQHTPILVHRMLNHGQLASYPTRIDRKARLGTPYANVSLVVSAALYLAWSQSSQQGRNPELGQLRMAAVLHAFSYGVLRLCLRSWATSPISHGWAGDGDPWVSRMSVLQDQGDIPCPFKHKCLEGSIHRRPHRLDSYSCRSWSKQGEGSRLFTSKVSPGHNSNAGLLCESWIRNDTPVCLVLPRRTERRNRKGADGRSSHDIAIVSRNTAVSNVSSRTRRQDLTMAVRNYCTVHRHRTFRDGHSWSPLIVLSCQRPLHSAPGLKASSTPSPQALTICRSLCTCAALSRWLNWSRSF